MLTVWPGDAVLGNTETTIGRGDGNNWLKAPRMMNTAICPRVMLSSGQNRRGAEAQPSVIARARRNPIASKNGYGSGTSAKVSGAARWVTVNGVKNVAGASGIAKKSSVRDAP